MDAVDLKTLVEQFAQAFNNNDLPKLASLLSPTIMDHSTPAQGREQVASLFSAFRAAFPDAHITTEDILVDGDKAAWRTTTSGTHLGDAFGIRATRKRAVWTGIDIFRVVDGQIVERWYNVDNLGQFQQLGLLPTA